MIRFEPTQWSIVVRARGADADARTALDSLCRTYRPSVLAYIRSRCRDGESAEDLTQSFFVDFIQSARHAGADPARGRFRAYLLTSLQRFLANAETERRTLKRGGGQRIQSLDAVEAETAATPGSSDPERAFERGWALAVLDAALRRLKTEAGAAGKREMFEQLREFLIESPDEDDYERVARKLNLRRNTLAVTVHRMRHRLRELVRAELAQTTDGRAALESELRHLRAALAGVMG